MFRISFPLFTSRSISLHDQHRQTAWLYLGAVTTGAVVGLFEFSAHLYVLFNMEVTVDAKIEKERKKKATNEGWNEKRIVTIENEHQRIVLNVPVTPS